MKKFTIIIEKDEDNWLVSEVVELPGCHTQAKTMDQLIERTREAIQAYNGKSYGLQAYRWKKDSNPPSFA